MGEFRINKNNFQEQMGSLDAAKNSLYIVKGSLASEILALRVAGDSTVLYSLRNQLGIASKKVGNEIQNINTIKNAGNQIVLHVCTAEKKAAATLDKISEKGSKIPSFQDYKRQRFPVGSVCLPIFVELSILEMLFKNYKSGKTNPVVNNPIYGDPTKKQYGGNQSGPTSDKAHFDDYAKLVRKYHSKMSKQEIEDYLVKLEDEGCGYIAIANTIFGQYAGKEKEFEKTFGFPMYDEDGRPNINMLVVDFYSATDNHNKGFLGIDTVNNNEDSSSTDGGGTTREKREYRWEMYMKDHGVDVNVHNIQKVTPDNYNKIAKNGEIVVGISPLRLYDSSTPRQLVDDRDGGHAMTVTGVTEDGYLKVSSWGEDYYINPNDPAFNQGHIQFQQVTYK